MDIPINPTDRNNERPSLANLQHYVLWWNSRFPYDRWWREKHKVAFMSPRHKEANFIHMKFEYEEDRFFRKLLIERNREDEKEDESFDGVERLLKRRINPSTPLTDQEFDDIDINNLNLNDDGSIKL